MFVVCGEALMDVFAAGATPSGLALDARVGGSPFNVAVGLARLQQPVALLAALSRDFLGDRLLCALTDEGVDTRAIHRVDAPTTLSLVGTRSSGVPSYSFLGHGGADRQLPADACSHLPQGIAALQVGSYAMVVEPIASTLRQLVERERHHTLVCFDPNVRLNVEPDLARWRHVLQWMLSRAHVLKISEEDLALLHPELDPQGFASIALAEGTQLVIVTRGADGAMGWTAQAQVNVAPVPVDVIDSVGAGDTFQAALLAWLAENDVLHAPAIAALTPGGLRNALEFASRAAAITCSRRGADLPRRCGLARARSRTRRAR
jgi:fructokinase